MICLGVRGPATPDYPIGVNHFSISLVHGAAIPSERESMSPDALALSSPPSPKGAAPSPKADDKRQPIRKVAKIATGDLVYLYDCALRDISASGARVGVQDASAIPDHIFLVFLTNQLVREARVSRRAGTEIDVEFIGPPKWLDMHREQVTPATDKAVDLTLVDD
jgi:hypothetical protein